MALPGSGAITLAQIQTEFGGANPVGLSEYYRGGAYTTNNNTGVPTSGQISLSQFYGAVKDIVGQIEYTTPGTYTFVVPALVTSVCVVCVGSNNGTGGALSWGNSIPVTPGASITVGVYQDLSGTICSYFKDLATLYAGSSTIKGGTYRGGGGDGGNGTLNGAFGSAGGGAGGYSGNGGAGGSNGTSGGAGAGGGGGGGGGYLNTNPSAKNGGGGGVGLLGQGANGAGGAAATGSTSGGGGTGGSGGTSGTAGGYGGGANPGNGGAYGGGGGGNFSVPDGNGGALRIIWGSGRSFPSTNTGNL